MTRNLWGNICPFQQQRSAQVNLFVIVFPVAPKMLWVCEEKALEKEKRLQQAMLSIKKRHGKNAILHGTSFEEGATGRDRNKQIGGHKA